MWVLGLTQSSVHHAIRVSAGLPIDGFSVSRLSGHAVFPFGFRFQVGPVAQRSHVQPFPCHTGINSRCDATHKADPADTGVRGKAVGHVGVVGPKLVGNV
jgi:hypothetical protein